jgi:hypothetical protein
MYMANVKKFFADGWTDGQAKNSVPLTFRYGEHKN